MKWISVKDKIPDEDGVYLTTGVQLDLTKFTIFPDKRRKHPQYKWKSFTCCGGYNCGGDNGEDEITHWMIIPEEPQ